MQPITGFTFTNPANGSLTKLFDGNLVENFAVTTNISGTPTPTKTPTPTPVTPTSTPVATPTPVPNGTRLDLTLLLHGIGKGGDNANPTGTGNNSPLHPTRSVTIDLFDSSNSLIKSVSGTLSFNIASGNFTGTIDGGTGITTGNYIIKIKSSSFLIKQVGGITSITSSQSNSLPSVTLIGGDANNDNALNILDYNTLLDCYSELAPARNCDPTKLIQTDFNDDGLVNQFDYNFFLRELSVQTGQ